MVRQNSTYIIATGFVLVLALLTALAVTGLQRMTAINSRMETITHNFNAKADLIFSLRHIIRERTLSTYAMYVMDDPFKREEELARFTEMAGEFIQLRDRLVGLGLNEQEKAALEKILVVLREIQPLHVKLVEKITSENRDGVKEEILRHDLLRQQGVLQLMDDMVDLVRAETGKASSEAEQEYRFTYVLMLALTILTIIFGVLIAWYVVRRTSLIENALARQKEQAEITLHSVGDAVITADEQGNVIYLNPVAEQLTGWRKEEARAQPLRNIYRIVNETTRKALEHPAMMGVLDMPIAGLSAHTILISRTGEEFAVEDNAAPIRDGRGQISGAILVFRDVTAPRQMQKQIGWQASHDPLTGLANRREFEALLERSLASAREQRKQHALLYLDLDQFKVINDTCGHMAGDELLKQVANLLLPLVRGSDTLARLGGDEFGVLIEGCSLEQAEQVAQKLHRTLVDFRFVWREKNFRIGVSIGLVAIHAQSGALSNLFSAADAACYMAKEQGRNRIWIHQENDSETVTRHGEMEWVSRITQAFDDNRFRLYFQRIQPLGGGADGEDYCELLVRMLDESGAVIPPMAFIPAAERYGIMSEIDRWVVRHAFDWLARHPAVPGFSINLSGQSIGNEHFLDFVMEQFRLSALDPAKLCFEITETVAIANWSRASHFIFVLKGMGCRFALDDFGSGMASFAYLKGLAVDFIKIDGVFVRDMVNDQVDHAMVEMINHIGHVMGIQTIAEYVENEEILRALQRLGVDYVQGFGIHKPEPLERLEMKPSSVRKVVTARGRSSRQRGRY